MRLACQFEGKTVKEAGGGIPRRPNLTATLIVLYWDLLLLLLLLLLLVVVVVVVVELFIHGAVKATVTNAAVSAKQVSLQQFLELADCRVGLTQWSRQTVSESGSSDLVTKA